MIKITVVIIIFSFLITACNGLVSQTDVRSASIDRSFSNIVNNKNISTKNFSSLPQREKLKTVCKAISVLGAIFAPNGYADERYYCYYANFYDGVDYCRMDNGSGDEMIIFFLKDGCFINGFAHEYICQSKEKLTLNILPRYYKYINHKLIVGTTFCLWTSDAGKWRIGEIKNYNDGSADLLELLDGHPQTYIDWAKNYYFEGNKRIPLKTITQIYNGDTLTKKMVLSIDREFEEWDKLQEALDNAAYPYKF